MGGPYIRDINNKPMKMKRSAHLVGDENPPHLSLDGVLNLGVAEAVQDGEEDSLQR